MKYAEAFSKLSYEVATVIFMKKDGSIRTMLCTRNLKTVEEIHGFKGRELGGHDNRCNITNGNLAVIDVILGESRSFSVDRVASIEWHGIINNKEELEKEIEKYVEFKKAYEKNIVTADISMIDSFSKGVAE
jgi:hypothetical protein